MKGWLEAVAGRTPPAPRPPGDDEAPYADGWLDVRRRRRALLLNPAGGFAMMIVLALLGEGFAALRPLEALLPFCALSIFAGWTYSVFRYGLFRCPRCGSPFKAVPPPDPAIDRVLPHNPGRCGYCHLRKWAVNDAGLMLPEYERKVKEAEAAALAAGPASPPLSADAPLPPPKPDSSGDPEGWSEGRL
jgi:hypothetical protein